MNPCPDPNSLPIPWARGEHAENAAYSRLSHELRTPITVITLAGYLLESSVSDENGALALCHLKKASARMTLVVEDLLLYTRLRGRRPGVGRVEVELGVLTQNVVAALGERADELGVEIVIRADDPAQIQGDSYLLTNAVRQMVSNALAFSPRGGVIAIRVERRGGGIELSVEDSGPGIPAERLPFIFQAFYQGENPMIREIGGLGLGLTLARLVAEAHGGRGSVESRTGGGSRFALWLGLPRACLGDGAADGSQEVRSQERLGEERGAALGCLVEQGLVEDVAGDEQEGGTLPRRQLVE